MGATRRILLALLLPLMLLVWWFVPGIGRTASPSDIGQAFDLDWTQEGNNTGDQLGYAVGTAGDVNGDGFADVIVGAPNDVVVADKVGIAYVFHGSAGGLSDSLHPDRTVAGTKGSLFGSAVGTAGDVNNDGYDDVIVGAPKYKNPNIATGTQGAAFVFYGSSDGLVEMPEWSLIGEQKDSELGIAVDTAGDVNGDTYDDIIIGADKYSNGEDLEGMIYVFLGAASGLTTTRVVTVDINQANALFGFSVGAAGDVNDDGYDDILVGAPGYNISGTLDAGAVFVFYGATDGISTTYTAIYGDQSDARYGHAVSSAGDVNGDGCDDIIVGAPLYDKDTLDSAGAAFVYLGSATGMLTTPHRQLYGDGIGAQFGTAVGAVGDTNQDDYADVIIGAPHATYDQDDEGAVYVYLGSLSGLSTSYVWRGEGNKNEPMYGSAVGSAGYVNDDSFVDIIVGAPDYKTETEPRGRALVYLGTGEDTITYYIYLPLVLRSSF
ncbi:MAG: FG-GAP repeat protein [Anaerolineae bacterium]|nr:FG-GAP repeat protein [Anaerolineae bacterium]